MRQHIRLLNLIAIVIIAFVIAINLNLAAGGILAAIIATILTVVSTLMPEYKPVAQNFWSEGISEKAHLVMFPILVSVALTAFYLFIIKYDTNLEIKERV